MTFSPPIITEASTCISTAGKPTWYISFITEKSNSKFLKLTFTSLLPLNNIYTMKLPLIILERTVATAAPSMPILGKIPYPNINSGSSIIFMMEPISMVTMGMKVFPSPLSMLLAIIGMYIAVAPTNIIHIYLVP